MATVSGSVAPGRRLDGLPSLRFPAKGGSHASMRVSKDEQSAGSVSEWRNIMDESYGELDFMSLDIDRFAASLQTSNHLGFSTYGIRGSELRARRTVQQVRRGATNQTIMIWQLGGRCVASQGKGRSTVEPGDIVFIDFDTPYIVDCITPFAQLVVQVPSDALLGHPSFGGQASCLNGVKLDADSTPAVAPWLAFLWAFFEQPDPARGSVVSPWLRSAAIDAISNLASAAMFNGAYQGTPKAGLRARALSVIDAKCQDPGLDAGSIARELNISRRTLFRLFRDADMRIESCIQEARLRRAVQLLRNDRTPMSVETIAHLSGFKSTSHFHAKFLDSFSLTPGEYRRNQRGSVLEAESPGLPGALEP